MFSAVLRRRCVPSESSGFSAAAFAGTNETIRFFFLNFFFHRTYRKLGQLGFNVLLFH